MLLNAIEKPATAGHSLPPYLLELLGQARRSIEVDPGFTRRCLDEVSTLLGSADAIVIDRDIVEPQSVPEPTKFTKGGLAPWQLKRVRAYVEEELDGTILIEDLAIVAELSPGHFCRAFKASTGETPHGFIVSQRIRRAQRLMLDTNDTLSQIACACGLTDQAHLTRLFRRVLNETPLAWRRNWRTA
ncbi:helix-turn-helix domain-containing protein [Sphingomonas abietis]|uniref:AraC family transcriptional regulator n=1 Tax=Sphingomonas abietis TaxID=3012344 RepID=A0ABY7NPD8_9SPHN|nr:AraC family transcriptional regulator [Sphingomonas abietis]WBO21794.1 AraC family transcriptional regulator [Sphingomonas abietis]